MAKGNSALPFFAPGRGCASPCCWPFCCWPSLPFCLEPCCDLLWPDFWSLPCCDWPCWFCWGLALESRFWKASFILLIRLELSVLFLESCFSLFCCLSPW